MKALISAGFSEGHVFPALALADCLGRRGHEVHVGLSRRWRETIEQRGLGFSEVEEYVAFPGATPPSSKPTVVDAARRLRSVIDELGPDVVVSDFVSPAPALAAELAGVRNATLIATVYPVQSAGMPPFPVGLLAPRTRAGEAAWRRFEPHLRRLRASSRWLARVPQLLDDVRLELGLASLAPDPQRLTTYGAISDGLAMVATFPQLEYPRRWPANVHVTGPMRFDLSHPEIELPRGDTPLVVVATSTVQDPGFELVRTAIEALSGEPVRVLAMLNRRDASWPEPGAENVTVVDWASYAQVMPPASLVISSGGQGTVARALSEGVPVLICPTAADTAENGARVTWAGAGLMLPARLRRPTTLRLCVKRMLAEPAFAKRAGEIAEWGRANDGAARGADLIESYVLSEMPGSSAEVR